MTARGTCLRCREAYREYLDHPTVANRERLKRVYEEVPEHHRMYVGDMDTKDIPVRTIIYGEGNRGVVKSFLENDLMGNT